ncbi:hypothetical protein GCM10007140_18980 [Priestia taiwanensis]|uniref:Uncharacterized protein n=1 Tax=Priestia taiwanensis TaxID=1347902 RepID=A0A917AQZ2_9BACI|nr:hypothetical protein GCM10007140_18980 [Priestia taiwanensis]
MLTELYRNRMKYVAKLAVIFLPVLIVLFVVSTEEKDKYLIGAIIVLMLFLFVGTIIRDYYKMKHVSSLTIPVTTSHVMDTEKLIMKQAAWWFPRYWLFTTKGEYLGEIRLSSIPWYWHVLAIYFKKEIPRWFPFTAELRDHEGNKLAFFTKQAGFKQTNLTFFNKEDKKMGEYIQHDLKSVMNIYGTLNDADGKEILQSKVHGKYGDFRLVDAENKHFATFKYGIFPLEYWKVFEDTYNPIIEMNIERTEEEKALMLLLISWWFMSVDEQ